MRYLSQPVIRGRLHGSISVLVACLAFPAAASAQLTGLEAAARGIGDGFAEMSTKPISTVTVGNASGATGELIPLTVAVSAKPGQPMPNTFLVGLPEGARLADADHTVTATDEKAAIDVTDWDLPRLSVVLSPTQAGTYTVTVVAASRPDNDGPTNFTTSTFTLKATSESRDAAPASSTPVPETLVAETKRPDAAVVREALPPPLAAPPSATVADNMPVQVGAITPKMATRGAAVVRPKTLVNLWREETSRADTRSATVAPPSPSDRRDPESRPAAAPPALAALPPSAPATTAPVVTPLVAASPGPAPEVDGKALVERAERLIRLGDISGARLVLERAADRGDPKATFLLAQTWDPRMLRVWKVQGLKPDPDRARALYAKAAQEGHHETRPIIDAGR